MVVEEGNLTTQVGLLRKALGTAPDGGEYIVNVPRIGYRFAAPCSDLTPRAHRNQQFIRPTRDLPSPSCPL